MHSAIQEAKVRADLILTRAKQGDAKTLSRFSKLPSLKDLSGEALQGELSRKHALTVVAREFGFPSWPEAKAILSGAQEGRHFGNLLYPESCVGFLNHWYAHYDEARIQREQTNGYLLAYRQQFFVVGPLYIRTMGLDPHDGDWEKIGRDWARPKDLDARSRLYSHLIATKKREEQNQA